MVIGYFKLTCTLSIRCTRRHAQSGFILPNDHYACAWPKSRRIDVTRTFFKADLLIGQRPAGWHHVTCPEKKQGKCLKGTLLTTSLQRRRGFKTTCIWWEFTKLGTLDVVIFFSDLNSFKHYFEFILIYRYFILQFYSWEYYIWGSTYDFVL